MSFRFVQFWFMSSFLNFRPNGCHYKLGQWVFHLTFGNSPNSSFVKSGKIGKIHPKRSERTIKWKLKIVFKLFYDLKRIVLILLAVAFPRSSLYFCSARIHVIWFKDWFVRSFTWTIHLDRSSGLNILIVHEDRPLGSSTWIVPLTIRKFVDRAVRRYPTRSN